MTNDEARMNNETRSCHWSFELLSFLRHSSETGIRDQDINPVYAQQRDDDGTEKILFRCAQVGDSQARPARDQYHCCICIKDRHRGQTGEDERIPFPGGAEMAMEKLDGGSRSAARDAGMSGQGVKGTNGPGQPEREPGRRQGEATERNAQRDQFMINLAGNNAMR
jgi:hypothetical protein